MYMKESMTLRVETIHKAELEASSVEDRVLVQLYIGLTEAELGRTSNAESAFRNALVLNPDADLPQKTTQGGMLYVFALP
jgi:hypothetical protein